MSGNVRHSIGNLDNHSIAVLSQLRSQSGLAKRSKDISRGKTPVWNRGKEPFLSFEWVFNLWMESHELRHLLTERAQSGNENEMFKQARMILVSQLTREDETTSYSFEHLCESWDDLLAKYHPIF